MNTFGIVFYLRRQKGKNGRAPVYVRITVDGKRTDISLKKTIAVNQWSSAKGMGKGNSEQIKILNTYLEQIRSQIVESYQQLQLKRELITVETVKNKYLGIEEKEHSVMSLFEYHNREMKNVLEWGTLKNYFTTAKYFKRYMNRVLHTSDIYLSELRYKFLTRFEKFMRESESLDPNNPCNHNTIMKHIERFKKVINLAIRNEWMEKDPFLNFKMTFIRKEIDHLSNDELKTLEFKKISVSRLQPVRDLFVFSCYTGLAYGDVYNLTPDHIKIGIDGEQWLTTYRKKTDQPVKVPLLPQAMAMINKYKNHPTAINNGKLFPVLTNQKTNYYLKEIAKICGIEKHLTFHMARHTFATTVTLTNGVPIETVSKLLGHTSIRTTQIYAKVIDRKVGDDMKRLKSKICGK
jgi:integrase